MALKIRPKRIGRQRRGRPEIERKHPIEKAVAIAFSYSGIVKLGCRETEAHPFPSPFRSGMGSDLRALLLRDRSGNGVGLMLTAPTASLCMF